MATKTREKFDAYVVYYRRDGKKMSKLYPKDQLILSDFFIKGLKRNKRKFLGRRPVVLAPVD